MRTIPVSAAVLVVSATLSACWSHVGESEFVRAVGGHNLALVAFVEPTRCVVFDNSRNTPEISRMLTVAALRAKHSRQNGWQYLNPRTYSQAWIAVLINNYAATTTSYRILRLGISMGTEPSHPTEGQGPQLPLSSITSFLRRAARPTITLLDEKKITAFQSIDDAVIVAHLSPRDQHIKDSFKSLAHRYEDRASFGQLEIEDELSSIVCYNNRDDEQSTTADLVAIEALSAFVKSCMEPLIGEFSRRTEFTYQQSGKSLVYYLAKTRTERENYANEVKDVAKKYRQVISFVTVDATEYGPMTKVLGLPPDKFPALAIENTGRGQIFPFTDAEISADTIDQFVLDIAGGKVKPWSLQPVSEPVHGAHDEL